MQTPLRPIVWVFLLVLNVSDLLYAQGPLVKARESYAAASYEECVSVLDQAVLLPGQIAQAGEYHALCLLALNREAEAAAAVEKVIRAVPIYTAPANGSPRLKSLVGAVRKSVLPSLVQDQYAAGKRAYDGREHAKAAEMFRLVLTLLKDPEIALASELAAADYGTLASGFLELIDAASAPPAVPAAPPAPEIFTAGQGGVIAPVPIDQAMPKWARPSASSASMPYRGRLELVIDTDGRVESATLLDSVHPSYDQVLLRAAREWTYEPALKDGQPVKFRKVLAINVEHR